MKKEIKKCKYCGRELVPLNPLVEEYIEYKLLIKIPFTNWKFMLLRDTLEYGCPDCLVDEQQSRESDEFDEAVNSVITKEIEKGNLIIKS